MELIPSVPSCRDRTATYTGVTSLGGTGGGGILFEVSTLGVYTILHHFGDGSVPNDGLSPQGSLVLGKDNNLSVL